MGIFDGLSPILSGVDAVLAAVLPAAARIVVWAAVVSVLSTWLYARSSHQCRLGRLAVVARKARNALAAYDGDFRGARHRIRRLLKLSWARVAWALGPAMLASVPLLLVLVWLGTDFNHRFPAPREVIDVEVHPADAVMRWRPSAIRRLPEGQWQVAWPAPGDQVEVVDRAGGAVVVLPPSRPVPILHQRRWHNLLFGNPGGYLPPTTPLQRVSIGLPKSSYLPVGPRWLRSAEAVFLLVVTVCSLVLKLAFRIE